MEHSSSLITESVWVAANGGCMGFFIIGGGDTAIMCSTSSAGLFPEYGLGLGHLSLFTGIQPWSVVKRWLHDN